jgi:hypothetical protein
MTGLAWQETRHLPVMGQHSHPHKHGGESWHDHPHGHHGDGDHIAADPHHLHAVEDLNNLRSARHTGTAQSRQRQVVSKAALARGGWSEETISATAEADELLALSAAGEEETVQADEVYGDSSVLLTPYELALAEGQVAAQIGAYDTVAAGDAAASEVFRYTQRHQEDQLRSMNCAVPPRPIWQQRAETPASSVLPLTAEDLDGAVYEESEFNGVIPEHSTTWHDPRLDGDGAGNRLGERAVALSRVARALQGGAAADEAWA